MEWVEFSCFFGLIGFLVDMKCFGGEEKRRSNGNKLANKGTGIRSLTRNVIDHYRTLDPIKPNFKAMHLNETNAALGKRGSMYIRKKKKTFQLLILGYIFIHTQQDCNSQWHSCSYLYFLEMTRRLENINTWRLRLGTNTGRWRFFSAAFDFWN